MDITTFIEECKKDPSNSVWAVCDASTFIAESYMERYESLYIKIVEMTNILIAKGASEDSLTLVVPPYMTERLAHNSTQEQGRHHVGWCNMRWKVYQDSEMSKDTVEIGSDKGKAMLLVLNAEKNLV